MNDLDFQADYVARQAWRLCAMQDANPASPSYGCFHYAYWRDKTSEFADARFQEAGPTLALLSLPAFDSLRATAGAPSSEVLRDRFRAALRSWEAQQYPEGCWDEWYKGERGFAATHFTTVAFGLVAWLAPEILDSEDRAIMERVMCRAGNWLLPRHDRIKSNHEAAAAAALTLIHHVTGDERFSTGARGKVDDFLARRTRQNWYPELGALDLGYCFVSLDYLMLYELISGDATAREAMGALFAFCAPHIHPDFTVASEAGVCLNPYLGRLGAGLLSPQNSAAAGLVEALETRSAGFAGLAPYLADDLRICRWSYLPLVTHLLRHRFRRDLQSTGAFWPDGWTLRAPSGIVAGHVGTWHVYFSAAGGGTVHLFSGDRPVAVDHGLVIRAQNARLTASGYNSARALRQIDDGFETQIILVPAVFFFPSFTQRLVLRLFSLTPWGARFIRALIDRVRIAKKSAVNQSSAPVAGGNGDCKLSRSVQIRDGMLILRDRLESRTPLAPGSILLNATAGGKPVATPDFGPAPIRTLTIEKSFGPGGDVAIAVTHTA